MEPVADIHAFMKAFPDGDIGVAVSGGGDSIALLVLLNEWAEDAGRSLRVATVDHGLRAESAAEAQFVAQMCADLGVEHSVLYWDGPKDRGNLQDAARQARFSLIGKWAAAHQLSVVATGHTRDDQAETFLMRLKRGSGVDGLSGMRSIVHRNGVDWIRPLLSTRRETLRQFLRDRGITWVDDPSNDDARFDRVKMRNALSYLDEMGLNVARLADTAAAMAQARDALEIATLEAAHKYAEPRDIGSVRLSVEGWKGLPEEIRLRVLAHSLGWVSGSMYRPRLKALKVCAQAMAEAHRTTLLGCLISPLKNGVCEISREVGATCPSDAASQSFDGRWNCSIAVGEWRALGVEGLKTCPEWREMAESREAVMASPSLWYNNELKSAPFAGKKGAGTCWLAEGTESFFATIVTH